MAETTPTFSALKESNFLRFTMGSLVNMIGRQMLTVAVGWDIYERTHSAIALGYIGLAQFLPVLLLTLYAGHMVDTYDRRKVLLLAQLINAAATGGLLFLVGAHGWVPNAYVVPAMYLCLLLAGVGRAFNSPANAALLPQIVSAENFTNAVTWGSMAFQTSAILGPALSGLLIGVYKTAWPVYLLDFLSTVFFGLILLGVKNRPLAVAPKRKITLKSLVTGVEFVWKTPLILAAITLDMFAVLFGGAVALLPVYAKDILHVGPGGLGWMQAAPSVGAIIMGYCLARMGRFNRAGQKLLWAVIGFGIVTIIFGLSRNFWLSVAMLVLLGALDNVSVVIRQALVQFRTPDEMRGRVSAINYVFIGTSNELGGFESGLVAHWMGPVFSVVFGGAATIATVLLVSGKWPELRELDRLQEQEEVS